MLLSVREPLDLSSAARVSSPPRRGPLPGKFLKLLGYLALSRFGIYVPLGGVNTEAFIGNLGQNSLLSTLDSFSGGGIGRLVICSLGIVPFRVPATCSVLSQVARSSKERRRSRQEEGSSIHTLRFSRFCSGAGAFYLPTVVLLIAFFNYYYTFLQLDPDDVSDQLKRQGASVPLVRPGKATAAFIKPVLSRISALGSAFLAILAAGPAVVEQVTHLTAFRGFAGTSVLILVCCAIDMARKMQAEIISQKYRNIRFYDINKFDS